MAKKKSVLNKLFSKSNKDCCRVEFEEVKPTNSDNCCDETKNDNKDQQQEEA